MREMSEGEEEGRRRGRLRQEGEERCHLVAPLLIFITPSHPHPPYMLRCPPWLHPAHLVNYCVVHDKHGPADWPSWYHTERETERERQRERERERE